MAFLTEHSYDLGPGTNMTPVEDPRRQELQPSDSNPPAEMSPLNFGLGEEWRTLQKFAHDNPAAIMSLGAGIMSGDTAGGLAQFGRHAQAALGQQVQTQRRNKTLDFLRANHPDLARMVDAGLPVSEAWQRVLAGWQPTEHEPDGMQVDAADDPWEYETIETGFEGRQMQDGDQLRSGFSANQTEPLRPLEPEPNGSGMTQQPITGYRPVFGSGASEELFQPSTREAYDSLPPGALYLDPGNGAIYRKS